MASRNPLNLPPVTTELKSIAPYLQRAEEVKGAEPIVGYWCAYYAAQIGIGLKARDAASRDVLLALLGALERLKNEIGSNDAVDVDAAGAAYVENFALRIFTAADNEDREGRATRATAKKFLAAANFLEVLKTFPKTDVSDSVAEKVRYAKWKAADIAKAFREGRKPIPGPPGAAEESQIEPSAGIWPQPASPGAQVGYITPPGSSPRSPPKTIPSAPSSVSYPPNLSGVDDNWSTIATPGTELNTSLELIDNPATGELRSSAHKRSSSGNSSKSERRNGRNTTASDEHTGKRTRTPSPTITPIKGQSPTRSPGYKPPSPSPRSRNNSPGNDKRVHFTPSVTGGSISSGSPATAPAVLPVTPNQPWNPPPALPTHALHPTSSERIAPGPSPSAPVELTLDIISKAQRHCRFAASALDYEDAETAKKELRAALALLGG